MSGRLWERFCEALMKVGHEVILSKNAPDNLIDRAEGWRYLARLTRSALDYYIEDQDVTSPRFRRVVHETVKFGMDNPDNVYLAAVVNGKYSYRITGRPGSAHYLGIGSQDGDYGSTGDLATRGHLSLSEIELSEDGTFTIIASSTQQEKNWLPLSEKTRLIQVRQTRLDHGSETLASLNIECIDADECAKAFRIERLGKSFLSAANFIHGTSSLFAGWAEEFRRSPNTLPRFEPQRASAAGGDPNIAYYHGFFDIQDDEALLIEVAPPACDYWNFQLANYWLESLDYRHFPIHINNKTARYEADGTVCIAIAKRDPGIGNWLDTCGRNQGTMCLRWVRAVSHPAPGIRKIKMKELPHVRCMPG